MDILGDVLTRIRNGYLRKKLEVSVYNSKFIRNVLDSLYVEGYIRGYSIDKNLITVFLKYKGDVSVISDIQRISTPGRRIYNTYSELERRFLKGELVFVSTNKGIFTNRAIFLNQLRVGGEVLLMIV